MISAPGERRPTVARTVRERPAERVVLRLVARHAAEGVAGIMTPKCKNFFQPGGSWVVKLGGLLQEWIAGAGAPIPGRGYHPPLYIAGDWENEERTTTSAHTKIFR